LSVPNIGSVETDYVTEAVRDGWVASGTYIEKFEREFAKYANAENMIAVQSGTAALHLALTDCGVGADDIVLVPTLTFIASVNPVRYVGAEPVFFDCDDSLCLDSAKLKRYFESECIKKNGVIYDKVLEKPVRAIIVVHIFGNGADMDSIMAIAEEYNIPVIEDAAEAAGTFYTSGKYKGFMAGTIGDYGIFSFNGNKIITTGGGGMVFARDPKRAKHIKHLSAQAKADEIFFDHDEIGFNYRMSNMQAALGVAQLERLESFIETKKKNYFAYLESGIELLPFSKNIKPNYWFYSHLTENRNILLQHLSENNIQARPVWKLIHTLPMYKNCRAYQIERALEYYKKIINLPCSSNLTHEDVVRVATVLGEMEE
jgi:aminotransferase in exopolysaccharide biosynthesis